MDLECYGRELDGGGAWSVTAGVGGGYEVLRAGVGGGYEELVVYKDALRRMRLVRQLSNL